MEYRALKLCAPRVNGAPRLTAAGQVIEIDDPDNAQALVDLGLIAPLEAAPADTQDNAAGVGRLDGDSFAEWVAAGAKVGQVIDWIGEDVARAEIALIDARKSVQKHIDGLLADGDDAGDDPDPDGDDAAGEPSDDAADES